MRRAEVWWAELPPPVGARPVVILTRNSILDSIGSVVVAIVTSSQRGLPTEVSIGVREGLHRKSVINVDNILTVSRHRLSRQMGSLSAKRVEELNRALAFSLELES
jgi:mRNA interferase MazF